MNTHVGSNNSYNIEYDVHLLWRTCPTSTNPDHQQMQPSAWLPISTWSRAIYLRKYTYEIHYNFRRLNASLSHA